MHSRKRHRWISALTFAAAVWFAAPLPTQAAELIMLEQPGCAWCKRWNAEIAPIYPKTPEGERAPLRRVDITKPWPDDLQNVPSDRFTPTFVLVHDGEEVDRMRGYVGDEFFWVLLEEMLNRLP
jgi:hypothetical protein